MDAIGCALILAVDTVEAAKDWLTILAGTLASDKALVGFTTPNPPIRSAISPTFRHPSAVLVDSGLDSGVEVISRGSAGALPPVSPEEETTVRSDTAWIVESATTTAAAGG